MIIQTSLWKWILLVAVLGVSYLVFSKPVYSQGISHLDKVGHVGGFFCLALLSHLSFKPNWYLLTGVLIIYGMFIELTQSLLPYRSATLGDLIADVAGVGLFYLLLWGYHCSKGIVQK